MKNNFQTLLIVGLLMIILFMKMCSPTPNRDKEIIKVDGKKYEIIKKVSDTQYIQHIEKVYKPGDSITKDTIIYVSVPKNVDTSTILQNYYNKIIYIDTLKLKDSLGYISIIVFQEEIGLLKSIKK